MPNGDEHYRPAPPPLWEQVKALAHEKETLKVEVEQLKRAREELQQRIKKLRGMVADQAESD